jgi:5-hydroxyisourate hydrolase-like protein (transthyretin family)
MSRVITVQVVDCVYGRPADGVRAQLRYPGDPAPVRTEVTDDTGRCHLMLHDERPSAAYQLVLDINSYFVALGIRPSCPEAIVTFRADITESILLVLTPTGYTTYYGSRQSGCDLAGRGGCR